MKHRISLAALFVTLGSLGAQAKTSTIPHEFRTMDGYRYTGMPFQFSNLRMQLYSAARHVGLRNPTIITHIGFRSEGNYMVQSKAKTLYWTLALGETKTSLKAVSKTFAKNATGTMTTVFQGKIQLPAQKTPQPFKLGVPVLMIKTQRPYVYRGGNLLLEILAQDPSGKNQRVPYYTDLVSSYGPGNTLFGMLGRSCPVGKNNYWTASLGNVRPGGNMSNNLRNVSVATGTAFLAFGTQSQRWGAVTLPLDLGPAGAPGCYLRTDILFAVPATVRASAATLSVPIPSDKGLIGQIINNQWLVVDPAGNKLGLTTSPLLQRLINATGTYQLDTAYLYWAGNGKPATQMTASTLVKRWSPVLLVGHL